MEQDRKFKLLKTRLEAMNYSDSFSIESAPLIESLLNDLLTLNQVIQKLRGNSEEKSLSRTNPIKEKDENLDFSKKPLQTETLLQIVSNLQKENKSLSQRLAGFSSIKKENPEAKTKEYIEKLFIDNKQLRDQIYEIEENTQKFNFENRSLIEKLKISESQILNLKKELEITNL